MFLSSEFMDLVLEHRFVFLVSFWIGNMCDVCKGKRKRVKSTRKDWRTRTRKCRSDVLFSDLVSLLVAEFIWCQLM